MNIRIIFLKINQRFQISSRLSIQDFICNKKNLKSILTSTGNIGVMWSELGTPVIIRAAVFWILCNLSLWYLRCHIRDYSNGRVWKSQGSSPTFPIHREEGTFEYDQLILWHLAFTHPSLRCSLKDKVLSMMTHIIGFCIHFYWVVS